MGRKYFTLWITRNSNPLKANNNHEVELRNYIKMANKKQSEVPTIDFDNLPKEAKMKGAYLHIGETIQCEDGIELHLCKRISLIK